MSETPLPPPRANVTPAPIGLRAPQFPGFVVEKKLGEGGMGVVYLALQQKLGRRVALKVIKEDESLESEDREKARNDLRKEAALLANLNHPNIVTVYDVGETDGGTYLCMEYLEQGSLADDLTRRAKSGEWPTSVEAAEAILTLAEALEAVHQKEVLHRDLKPGNVLVSKRFGDGRAVLKISDFGLARLIRRPSGPATGRLPTSIGKAKGTPAYMAPEQASRVVVNLKPAADVYALGAILYELLTVRPPYQGAREEILAQVISRSAEPPRPRKLNRRVPRDLEWICLKCLEYRWQKRYQSARALADDLHRFLDHKPVHACPTRLLEPAIWSSKWVQRNRWLTGFIALLFVLSIAGAFGTWYFNYLKGEERSAKNAETAQRIKADEQRKKAETLAAIARRAFSQSLEHIGREPLSEMTREEKVSDQLLHDALDFFQAYKKSVDQDPKRPFESGQTRRWIGDVLQLLGRNDEAGKIYAEAETFLSDGAGDDAPAPEGGRELAQLHNNLGILNRSEKKPQAAEAEFGKAVNLCKRLAKRFPSDPAFRYEQARDLNNLAALLESQKRYKDAEAANEEAARLLQGLADAYPRERTYRMELAETYEPWDNGPDEGEAGAKKKAGYLQAASVFDHLADEDPKDRESRDAQSRVRRSLGILSTNRDELAEAECWLLQARKLTKQTARDFDTQVADKSDVDELNEHMRSVAFAYEDDAVEAAASQNWTEAEAGLREAIRLLTALKNEPDPLDKLNDDLIFDHIAIASLFESRDRREPAEQALRAAVAFAPKNERRGVATQSLSKAFVELGLLYRTDGDAALIELRYRDAVKPYEKSLALLQEVKEHFPEGGVSHIVLALARDRLGRALLADAEFRRQMGEAGPAQESFLRAESIFRQAYDELMAGEEAFGAGGGALDNARGMVMQRRGECLTGLGKWKDARDVLLVSLHHLRIAGAQEANKPVYVTNYRQTASDLTKALVELRDHRALASQAAEWRSLPRQFLGADADAAAAFALCIPLAQQDADLPEEKRACVVQHYGDEAVAALRDWVQKTYDERNTPFNPADLDQFQQLKSLRPLDEYQTFLAERRSKVSPTPARSPKSP